MEPEYVCRGDLTPEAIVQLDEILASHGLEATTPYAGGIPTGLASVCLGCGSISIAEDDEQRDYYTKNFDFLCCGTTVYFHSTHAVLVDPDTLTAVEVTVVGADDEPFYGTYNPRTGQWDTVV